MSKPRLPRLPQYAPGDIPIDRGTRQVGIVLRRLPHDDEPVRGEGWVSILCPPGCGGWADAAFPGHGFLHGGRESAFSKAPDDARYAFSADVVERVRACLTDTGGGALAACWLKTLFLLNPHLADPAPAAGRTP